MTIQIKKRILNSFEMVEERNRISRTFGEYVSPIVMNKLLTLKPDLRSEKREVCVMFLDIRNVTSFAEKRSPEQQVSRRWVHGGVWRAAFGRRRLSQRRCCRARNTNAC